MLSALDLARRVESGELTPARLVELCADAIAEREAEIGAFVTLDLDGARRTAAPPAGKDAPKVAAKDLPLRGLPVGLKDIVDSADLPTEYGSPIYAGHRPRADASIAALVRRAGGNVIGKTVTAEFAHTDPGKTRNPVKPSHTPGGSSSGSAAAVAAGFVPVAIGSQTGGSTVRPASYCGIAGYKPSFGLLPTVGMKCVSWHLDTVGLFAAGIADVAFAAAAIAGRDLRVDRSPPASPRIAVLRAQPWPQASADMQAALDMAARAASGAMARVKDIQLPPVVAAAFRAHTTIHGYEAARSFAFEYDRHRDKLGKSMRELIETGMKVTVDAYDDARRTASRARQALAEMMSDCDVILTPSAPGAAPEGLRSTGNSTFNRLWTLMGIPCINVPGLADDSGLPLGMQVIGRFGADRATLEAALFIESALARRK
ncbi:MAG: amidase [Alphaproteobacteria bacterium]|nr:amidase [Alphaproteobacteria bacterium]